MKRTCPVCLSTRTHFYLASNNTHGRHAIDKKETFNLYKCARCTAIFLVGINANASYYKKYYESDYYIDKTKSILYRILSIQSDFSRYMKQSFIVRYAAKKDRLNILDIGCGDGEFLANLDSRKFNKRGIEPNKKGYEISKRKGLRVFNGDVFKVKLPRIKFDVITLWHVLEHIDKPNALIKKIYSLLNPKGIIVIAVPDSRAIGFRVGKKDWFHLDSPRHLMIPNRKSITTLLKRNKFRVISERNEFYDFPLDLFWSIRKSLLKFLLYPIYPIAKVFDKETLTMIGRKK